jgi:predicted nucleotidyltransferase
MRISDEQTNFLKNEILTIVPEAVVYLFGSRVDDRKKGGDIDIMILSNKKLNWKEKSGIKWEFFDKYGEQKLDIISSTFNESDPFKELVIQEGIRL